MEMKDDKLTKKLGIKHVNATFKASQPHTETKNLENSGFSNLCTFKNI